MTLFLLPNLLDENGNHEDYFSKPVIELVPTLDFLLAETEKKGRLYLKRFSYPEGKSFRDIPIFELNKHSDKHDVVEYIEKIKEGGKWGLISDCGLPCIADPGSKLVFRANEARIKVEVFAGPSSILFALMLSGLSSQSFTFHGYIPKNNKEGKESLKVFLQQLERESSSKNQTQIFIDSPYKSKHTLENLVNYLSPETFLSIASNITLPDQIVMTKKVSDWKINTLPDLKKNPTVFLFNTPKSLNKFKSSPEKSHKRFAKPKRFSSKKK